MDKNIASVAHSRVTRNIGTLAITLSTAAYFVGCSQKMPLPQVEAEATMPSAYETNAVSGTNAVATTHYNGTWYGGRPYSATPVATHSAGYEGSKSSYSAQPQSGHTSSAAKSTTTTRGGFGSTGRAFGGAAS